MTIGAEAGDLEGGCGCRSPPPWARFVVAGKDCRAVGEPRPGSSERGSPIGRRRPLRRRSRRAPGATRRPAGRTSLASACHGHDLRQELAPEDRGAARLTQISDIGAVVSPDTFVRPIYAGNALATVRCADPIKVITVRGTGFAAGRGTGGSASLEPIASPPMRRGRRISSERSFRNPTGPSSPAPASSFRADEAWDRARTSILERVADRLGAAVGATRAAVDSGFVPNDYQVGQTGKIVAPELDVAVGISGAIQHLAGMKDFKVIVAINKDEEAPIFQIADYGLVADLFQTFPNSPTSSSEASEHGPSRNGQFARPASTNRRYRRRTNGRRHRPCLRAIRHRGRGDRHDEERCKAIGRRSSEPVASGEQRHDLGRNWTRRWLEFQWRAITHFSPIASW